MPESNRSWRQPNDAERAELATLLESISDLGRTRHRLALIVVSYAPDLVVDGDVGIVGPRGYRHPRVNPDPCEIFEWSSPTGIVRIVDRVAMPKDCAGYLMLVDRDDPDPSGPVRRFSLHERERPELAPLLSMFERAGRLVRALGVLGPISSRRDDLTWYGTLLGLVEPDMRFTWGEPARQFFPPDEPDDGIQMFAFIDRDHDRALPCCQVFEDTVHASQSALRRLLAAPAAEIRSVVSNAVAAEEGQGEQPRPPSEADWVVWHLHRQLGGTQGQTAERLAALGAPRANQGAVSRALRSCRLWIESGGHVPDPPRMPQASPRRARTMDPSKLEQGSGRRSQRPRSEESE
ncbi:MAG: hypothetical protein H6806_03475 [Planctomycetes bacterium]|nr:hypothetical protein [Planctomycetota bacterium]MCB9825248.1 hypothetical protein [Planctomycetota bacterium]MCB9828814.1 hypothetical protein [Planctomycetota bacterium]